MTHFHPTPCVADDSNGAAESRHGALHAENILQDGIVDGKQLTGSGCCGGPLRRGKSVHDE